MSDQACTDALVALSSDVATLSSKMSEVAVLSSKMDNMTILMEKWTARLEGMANRMDIRLQEQERITAAHAVRIEVQGRYVHTLSNRIWALGGGGGLLGLLAMILQSMGW